MNTFRNFAALTALTIATAAWAQTPVTAPDQPEAAPPAPLIYTPPTWQSPEIEKIAGLLTGSWKTSTPIAEQGASGKVDVWMHIKPVAVQGLEGTLYVEQARSDAPNRPYRQAFFQLYPYKGKVRLRTLEFRSRDATVMTGLWLAPQYFPAVTAGEFVATIDIDLTPSANGYSGKTPYPYPTNLHGAVEMTSELSLSADTIVAQDRGFDASGKIVWGAGANDSYTFKKSAPPYTADVRDNGLIVITMVPGSGDQKVEQGERVGVHYTGWITDGTVVDSSRPRNRPLLYNHPRGVVAGWAQGLAGASKGEVRKILVPYALGYGTNPHNNIPAYSNLIFETEIMSIDSPPQPAPTPPAAQPAPGPQQPAEPK